MIGVVLGNINYSFVWKTCYLRHWAGSGGVPALVADRLRMASYDGDQVVSMALHAEQICD